MPKVKTFLPSTILGIYVKRYLPRFLLLGYLPFFTNRVITDFGSNFLKISRDWEYKENVKTFK